MLQVNRRRTVAEVKSIHCTTLNSSVFSMRWKELASWAEEQSNDCEFQTEGTVKAFADTASIMRGTDSSSSLSDKGM